MVVEVSVRVGEPPSARHGLKGLSRVRGLPYCTTGMGDSGTCFIMMSVSCMRLSWLGSSRECACLCEGLIDAFYGSYESTLQSGHNGIPIDHSLHSRVDVDAIGRREGVGPLDDEGSDELVWSKETVVSASDKLLGFT